MINFLILLIGVPAFIMVISELSKILGDNGPDIAAGKVYSRKVRFIALLYAGATVYACVRWWSR